MLLLTGCTGYKSYGLAGGFQEEKITNNLWRVDFIGNGYTNETRVKTMAMIRMADIGMQLGYDYFMAVTPNRKYMAELTPVYLYQNQQFRLKKIDATNQVIFFKQLPNSLKAGSLKAGGLEVGAYSVGAVCQMAYQHYQIQCGRIKIVTE